MLLRLDTFLILGICIITALNALRATLQQLNLKAMSGELTPEGSHSYVGTDFPRELSLRVSRAAMWFETPERYALNATDDWASTIPRGHGWVKLGPDHRPFAVTMYHQLHCIDGIRQYLLLSSKGEHSKAKNSKIHASHCFNYLRQLLLCGADITLEPTALVTLGHGKMGEGASGEGVPHTCRDWTQVRSMVEENSSQWVKWGHS
ncbi:hypothetical protein C8J57DRAFT_1242281 [Mycena rebaudengoi]|nr:hypothetical protein C8J57DRAFT_1242281 [Mycena rebaudengoi]